jgi:hypothetical protein
MTLPEFFSFSKPLERLAQRLTGDTPEEWRKRGLNGFQAFKCCMEGRNDVSRGLDQFADDVQEIFENRVLESRVLGSGTFTYRPMSPRTLPKTEIVETQGKVVVFHNAIDTDNPQAVQAMVEALRSAAKQTRTKTRQICEDCIRERLWKQTNPLVKETKLGRSRIKKTVSPK